MKKKIMVVLMLVFSVFFVGLGCITPVNAEGTFSKNIKARTKQGGSALTGVAKTGSIPASYGTFGFFKYTGDYTPEYKNYTTVPTAVKNAWASYSTKDATWNATFNIGQKKPTLARKNYSICVPHAALYNGNWIDIKGTVTNFEKSTYKNYEKANKNRKPTIAFVANKSSHRVSVNVQAVNWVTVKWSFTKYNPKAAKGKHCAGAAVSVKGNTSYRDVDWQQGIRLSGSTNKGLYIKNKNNKLRYGNVKNGSGDSVRHVFDKFGKDTTPADNNYAFTEIFGGSSITRTYTFIRNQNNSARGGIGMEYVSFNPITPSDPTKSRSVDKLTESTKQVYTVSQNIPNQDSSNYYKKVVIQDTLDNCYDMSKTTFTIKREDGKSATKYFKLSKSGQKVMATATAAALKNEDFYGATYQLIITTKIKGGYDFSKYQKDSKGYIIKNKGESIIDSKTRKTKEVTSHYEPPKCKYQYKKYYDSKGNIVTKEEYQLDCFGSCPPPKDGKYYDKDGKEVTQDEYYDSCVTPSEIPDPVKGVSTEYIRYNKEFYYGIYTKVPHVTKSKYYTSYVISDELEAPLKVTDASKIKVYRAKEKLDETTSEIDLVSMILKMEDVTDKFDINVSGQKVTVTLKDTNDSSFYGTRDKDENEVMKEYGVIIPAALKENVEETVNMSKYEKDGKYVIPDVAKVTATKPDGNTEEKETNRVDVYYEEDLPAQKSVNVDNVTTIYEQGGTYTYTIEKDVRKYSKNQYYTSFEMQDKFEDCIVINDTSKVKIINDINQDVTGWFDITINNNLLTATLKQANNNDEFYGHKYSFNVTVSIDKNADLDKYSNNNQYVIPNMATFIYDNSHKVNTNKVNVVIDMPKVVKKSYKAPNTASPMIVGAIVAGLAAIVGGAYFMVTQVKNDPLNKLKK